MNCGNFSALCREFGITGQGDGSLVSSRRPALKDRGRFSVLYGGQAIAYQGQTYDAETGTVTGIPTDGNPTLNKRPLAYCKRSFLLICGRR